MLFFFYLKIDVVIYIITITLYVSGDLIYTSTSYLKQSCEQMSSFISSPFKLLLGYWILRNLDDNHPCPPRKKLGQQPDWPTSIWPTGGPQEDLSWLFFSPRLITWLIVDIIKLLVVPLPPPIFNSSVTYSLVMALLHIYTWIFLNPSTFPFVSN